MRAVLQRVRQASVTVDATEIARIDRGLLALVCVSRGDGTADATTLADKTVDLRIFPDDAGKMNRSVADVGGSVLVVSQFTLCADVRKGRRPSFVAAAPPDISQPMLEVYLQQLRRRGIPIAQGRFGARMEVALINDGPVTVVVDVIDGQVR